MANDDLGKIAVPLIEKYIGFVRGCDRRDPQNCSFAAIIPFVTNGTACSIVVVCRERCIDWVELFLIELIRNLHFHAHQGWG
jgi:hypothetical protein